MSFFQLGPLPSDAITGNYYNYNLVALSYIIAVFASYVALDMAGRLRLEANRKTKNFWHFAGAFAMGAGIWSMHFIGMLAFIMPMPMSYNIFWTTFSMLVAIAAAALALQLLRSVKGFRMHMVLGGIVLGLAIATMHYTGMHGMQGVHISYTPGLFFLSILIAIGAAEAALWLALRSNIGSFRTQLTMKIGSALVMGAAIVGMHYTGMAAAVFVPLPGHMEMHGDIATYGLASYISVITFLIIGLAILASTHKQILVSAVQKEKDFINTILQNLDDGIVACNAKGEIILVNQAMQQMLGLKESEIHTGEDIADFYHPDTDVALLKEQNPLLRALAGEYLHEMELLLKTKQGQQLMVMIDGQPIVNPEQKIIGAVIALHDVTEQKSMQKQLMERATHDMLTDLPNRTLLIDRLSQAIKMARREKKILSVLYIDVDRFKLINDNFGHATGDQLLVIVGERLRSLTRRDDTVARMGGDEFVVILNSLEYDESSFGVAHKILNELAKPFRIKDNRVRITVSIGISDYPKNGEDPDTLLKNADTAMYRVKNQGRNNVRYFSEDMNARTIRRMELEQSLYHAQENKEFLLHYQPIIELKTGKITGCEALLRWQHPTLGLLYPVDFLPLIEETGLIVSIGEWVLRTACLQNKLWQSLELPFIRISVNVSAQQFNEHTFLSTVKNALDNSQLEPRFLELELTESAILRNPEETLSVLHALKELGITIALDDFGVGYSSLGYLSRLPVHKLKIDRSFVHNITMQPENSAIVAAIINMASSMRLKVTAEGMENEDELSFLRYTQCDEAQGYYFSRPLTVENMTNLLQENPKFFGNAPKETRS